MPITYRGETFSGYNKPKASPKGKKSHVVLIKDVRHSKLVTLKTLPKVKPVRLIGLIKSSGDSEVFVPTRQSVVALTKRINNMRTQPTTKCRCEQCSCLYKEVPPVTKKDK